MVSPDSLCAQIMKGRYYPDLDFMHAIVPKSASPIWQAIVAGREALQAGLIMRVGDGSSIPIWEDKWISDTISMSPMSIITPTTLHTVNELIDEENWTWKTDLVRQNFLAPDAEAILNIPLRIGGGQDFFAWAFENSGVYTVKL